jgi:hypothetical protein
MKELFVVEIDLDVLIRRLASFALLLGRIKFGLMRFTWMKIGLLRFSG